MAHPGILRSPPSAVVVCLHMACSARYLLSLAALFLCVLGCAPRSQVINYVVTSQSPYICCRTIRYSTWTFPNLRQSMLPGDGVVVRLTGDTVAARCETGATVGVAIANNGPEDIYIPVSKEMQGEQIKLYPWRLFYADGRPIRVARQMQYSDLGEREDPLLRFFRLPAGKEVVLQGMITERWLCAPLARRHRVGGLRDDRRSRPSRPGQRLHPGPE